MNKLSKLLDNEETIDLSLSYSRVSDFDRNGPKALLQKITSENEGMKHGSVVDILLTDRIQNTNLFNEEYVVYDENKPTATLGLLCDIILNNYIEIPDVNEVLNIVNKNSYWSKYKEDTKIANFNIPEFWDYLKIKFETKDKKIVTKEEYTKAKESVDIFLNHEYTKGIFNNNLENHYQYKIKFKYKNFTFKGILDKLTIDHTNKKVYMEDIKTGAPKSLEFMESFIKYRYYLQECVYSLAFEHICKELNLVDYKLMPFKFIYLSRTENFPLIYQVSEKWHNAALNGFMMAGKYKYRGLNHLLDDIYYHWKNKEFILPKEILEQNGCLILKDDFIEVNE
jgi:hypothetical protein